MGKARSLVIVDFNLLIGKHQRLGIPDVVSRNFFSAGTGRGEGSAASQLLTKMVRASQACGEERRTKDKGGTECLQIARCDIIETIEAVVLDFAGC